MVDDVSSDNTWNLLKKIEKNYSQVRIYQNQHNSKSAFTRNYAISKAKGKYIMQLDDDDYCEKTRMTRQVEFLDNNLGYDFVGSNVFLWDKEGIYGEIIKKEQPSKYDLLKTSTFINPSVMFRKEALERVDGYRVSRETVRGQDYDLFLRMYTLGMRGYNLQEKLVFYYKDQNYFTKINWKCRIGESKFRYRNFKEMGMLPKYTHYVLKPLLAILIPNKILTWNHSRKLIRNR